jgi:integrase
MASIKQYRGKTWRAIVRRKGFPVESKTFPNKRDAQAWAASVEARMGVSAHDPLQLAQARITTVKNLFERYRDEVVPSMKGRNEPGVVKRLIRDAAFMTLLLDKVRPDDIRAWRDARVKDIAPASVHRELATISAVFTYAMKEWGVPLAANPCFAVTRFKNADKPRDKRWNDADIQTFLKACKWDETAVPKRGRDYVGWALLLAIETAMREGELCLPLVSDFYPAELRVHLRDTKNGSARDVPLSKKALAYFTHLCKDKRPEDKIFPLVANTLGEYVLDVRRACGLEHLKFHDTRHEAATRMSTKLANVLELSAQTGHKSLKSLKRYYNPTPADIAAKLG